MNKNEDKPSLFNISRLNKSRSNYEKIIALHKRAIENNDDTYIDSETGYKVFTAKFLLERESCCGSVCRHCPY